MPDQTISRSTQLVLGEVWRNAFNPLVVGAQDAVSQAWFDVVNSSDVETGVEAFTAAAYATVEAAKRSAFESALAAYSMLTSFGLNPISVPYSSIKSTFDYKSAFNYLYHLLSNGAEFSVAADLAGAKVATDMKQFLVGVTREVATVAYERSGRSRSTRWARLPAASACLWCQQVARSDYLSAESATFGHLGCDCLIVPTSETVNVDGVWTTGSEA